MRDETQVSLSLCECYINILAEYLSELNKKDNFISSIFVG